MRLPYICSSHEDRLMNMPNFHRDGGFRHTQQSASYNAHLHEASHRVLIAALLFRLGRQRCALGISKTLDLNDHSIKNLAYGHICQHGRR